MSLILTLIAMTEGNMVHNVRDIETMGAECAREVTQNSEGYSARVGKLLAMIWAHESNAGKHNRQIGFSWKSDRGAFGRLQMERVACERVLRELQTNQALAERAAVWLFQAKDPDPDCWDVINGDTALYLIGNWDRMAVLFGRVYLQFFNEAVPLTDDELAKYAKKYWNTTAGKATPQDYLKAYRDALAKQPDHPLESAFRDAHKLRVDVENLVDSLARALDASRAIMQRVSK